MARLARTAGHELRYSPRRNPGIRLPFPIIVFGIGSCRKVGFFRFCRSSVRFALTGARSCDASYVRLWTWE